MSAGNSRRIPNFLSASSPKELMRRMLFQNIKDGMEYRYFDIQKDGKKWIAWFNREVPMQESASTLVKEEE